MPAYPIVEKDVDGINLIEINHLGLTKIEKLASEIYTNSILHCETIHGLTVKEFENMARVAIMKADLFYRELENYKL